MISGLKEGKCDHVIKDLRTSMTIRQCSTIHFNHPEINPRQSKNVLRIPYELVKISGDSTTITHKLATGRGE